MESLAALWTCGKYEHREASHSTGGCAGVHHSKRSLFGSGKLAGICWGGSIVFSLNGGLFLLGKSLASMNIVRMEVNGGLHELRGGCGRHCHAASHASSTAAHMLIGQLRLQITGSNKPVQIINTRLK